MVTLSKTTRLFHQVINEKYSLTTHQRASFPHTNLALRALPFRVMDVTVGVG
jgi:hypothetical protein